MSGKKTLKWAIVLLLIGGLIYLNQTVFDISPEKLKKWILSIGVLAPVLYVLLYSFRPFILFPASILSLAGGLAFGPLYGTLLTVSGATFGAVLAFMFARKVGAGKWQKRSGQKAEAIQTNLEKNGFLVVLLLRLIPLFHFDLISYVAGVSKVRLLHFSLGTFIGIIPGTFAYNFLGSSTTSGNTGIVFIAITFFAVLTILPILFRKKIKNFLAYESE